MGNSVIAYKDKAGKLHLTEAQTRESDMIFELTNELYDTTNHMPYYSAMRSEVPHFAKMIIRNRSKILEILK